MRSLILVIAAAAIAGVWTKGALQPSQPETQSSALISAPAR